MLKKCCVPPGWIQTPASVLHGITNSLFTCLSHKSTALTDSHNNSKHKQTHATTQTLFYAWTWANQLTGTRVSTLKAVWQPPLYHTQGEVGWLAVKATLWSCTRQVCFPGPVMIAWQAPSSTSFLGVVAVIHQHRPQLCEALLPPPPEQHGLGQGCICFHCLPCLPRLGVTSTARDTGPAAQERTATSTQNPPPPQSALDKRYILLGA